MCAECWMKCEMWRKHGEREQRKKCAQSTTTLFLCIFLFSGLRKEKRTKQAYLKFYNIKMGVQIQRSFTKLRCAPVSCSRCSLSIYFWPILPLGLSNRRLSHKNWHDNGNHLLLALYSLHSVHHTHTKYIAVVTEMRCCFAGWVLRECLHPWCTTIAMIYIVRLTELWRDSICLSLFWVRWWIENRYTFGQSECGVRCIVFLMYALEQWFFFVSCFSTVYIY